MVVLPAGNFTMGQNVEYRVDGERLFILHDNDIAWQIRDVYLDSAISELATRRSEFSALLRTSGVDALISSLNKKADDLRT